ncbi:MAG TPA: glycosyltransferase family 9 protein [Thermodesulfovibrionales bacterium]|nr:glycosyltransferase family 9 protein [Thermodesulfovibrionales bacterium]
MPQRIFIHHHGALGDLLLSLPAINGVRKPDDLIHLAGRFDIVEFLKKTGYIHEGRDADSAFFLPLFMEESVHPLDEFLHGFDRIILFSADRSSPLARNLLRVDPRTEIILTLPPDGSRMHVSDFRTHQIGFAGLQGPHTNTALPGLTIPAFSRRDAEEMLAREGFDFTSPLVAVHPGSGGRRKCWPLENYFALIETLLTKHGPFFLIFSGPAEGAEIRRKVEAFVSGKKMMLHVCDKDLITVAALLSLSTVYVGNDSGISHLAAAVNGNVIVLFGPTDPVLWRPLGDRVQVISSASHDASVSSISTKEVYEGIAPFLSPRREVAPDVGIKGR